MKSWKKPSATKRKITKLKGRRELKTREDTNKGRVRRRDRFCRFPLCGCRKLGLKLDARQEVSHQKHKGMGGDPTGDRSLPELMLYLCKHRHQDGAVSIHKGTLRARPLTAAGTNGPIAWDVDSETLFPGLYRNIVKEARWFEAARETKVQQLEPLSAKQQIVLERLGEMEL